MGPLEKNPCHLKGNVKDLISPASNPTSYCHRSNVLSIYSKGQLCTSFFWLTAMTNILLDQACFVLVGGSLCTVSTVDMNVLKPASYFEPTLTNHFNKIYLDNIL